MTGTAVILEGTTDIIRYMGHLYLIFGYNDLHRTYTTIGDNFGIYYFRASISDNTIIWHVPVPLH